MAGGRDSESGADQLMALSRSVVRDCLVVHVRGEVEAMTAPRMAVAVKGAMGEVVDQPVVVDLTGVTFLDSAGLEALVDVTEHGEDRGEILRIVVDHTRPVVRPLQITGLEHRMALYESIDEATAQAV
jgi:anti-sigma B factor antagonist